MFSVVTQDRVEETTGYQYLALWVYQLVETRRVCAEIGVYDGISEPV